MGIGEFIMSINTVTLVGRTTRDAKIVDNKNGSKAVLFTMAVERNYKDSEGNRPVDFISVKAFISDKAKSNGPYDYLKKGMLIGIEAELRSSQFEADGETRYVQDVIVKQNGLAFLEAKKSDKAETKAPAEPVEATEAPEISEDDLPF